MKVDKLRLHGIQNVQFNLFSLGLPTSFIQFLALVLGELNAPRAHKPTCHIVPLVHVFLNAPPHTQKKKEKTSNRAMNAQLLSGTKSMRFKVLQSLQPRRFQLLAI